jgi:hypothetical protein
MDSRFENFKLRHYQKLRCIVDRRGRAGRGFGIQVGGVVGFGGTMKECNMDFIVINWGSVVFL